VTPASPSQPHTIWEGWATADKPNFKIEQGKSTIWKRDRELAKELGRSTRGKQAIRETRGEGMRLGGSFFRFRLVMVATIGQVAQRTKFSLSFSLYLSLSREVCVKLKRLG